MLTDQLAPCPVCEENQPAAQGHAICLRCEGHASHKRSSDADACPECGVSVLQWRTRAEQAEAALAARDDETGGVADLLHKRSLKVEELERKLEAAEELS